MNKYKTYMAPVITATFKEVKEKSLAEHYRYSLHNLTKNIEHLSYDVRSLIELIKQDESNDDFLFWDNLENTDILVQY